MVAKGHVMTLRERLRTLPADAIWGYGAVIGYVATLATHVVAGPNLVLMVFTLLVLLLLGVIGSILVFRLLWGATSRQRVLPLVVVCICLASFLTEPILRCIEVQLVGRVYLAGGPLAIMEWGQKLIDTHAGQASHQLSRDDIPSRVQEYLPGDVYVLGVSPSVRIELGGGFFHYGIVVLPTHEVAEQEWWEWLLDWPPQVVVYAGD